MGSNRPIIRDLKLSRMDVALEVLALAGAVFLLVVPAFYYSRLPDRIPVHFNASGVADGWGSKSALFLTPLTALVMYVSLTVLSRFPHKFNYLWEITEANARRQYAIARQMLSAIKVLGMAIFSNITWGTIGTAMGTRQGLGAWFLLVTMPLLFGTIISYVYKGQRALSEDSSGY